MAYIASDKIGVFPLSKNRTATTPLNSRLFYESNVSNIINQLIDYNGFVISSNTNITHTDDTSSTLPTRTLTFNSFFEFNLYGYYIKIFEDATLVLDYITVTAPTDIYAKVTLSGDPQEIANQDVNSTYQGVEFLASEPDGGIYIHILTYTDDDGWKIPEDSKIKFKLPSLGITAIDGKH